MQNNKTVVKLLVYFENPFWVGIFEKINGNNLSVAKVTFGAEPKDYEILEFINKNYYNLKFSLSVEVAIKQDTINPKRRQKEARKQAKTSGIGTKSQQALKLQYEENKLERKVISKKMKEDEKQRQFELKKQKKKEKHKGR